MCLYSPRDTQSFMRFACQLEPHRAKQLYHAYLDACSEPFGFLVCDLTNNIHPALKYKSFPVSGVPGHGAAIYATEDDIRSLLEQDDRYARYSETPPSVDSSPRVVEQTETQETN